VATIGLKMKHFVDNNRTTTVFMNNMLLRICVSYKLMEYFEPDSISPSKNIREDFNQILEKDLDYENDYDREYISNFVDYSNIYGLELGSSYLMESIYQDTIKLVKYMQNKRNTKRIINNQVSFE